MGARQIGKLTAMLVAMITEKDIPENLPVSFLNQLKLIPRYQAFRQIHFPKTLKEYEDMLPPDIFFRVHHSHLVNIHFIVKYNKGKGGIIEMKDKSIIPLATRRKNDFINLFVLGE